MNIISNSITKLLLVGCIALSINTALAANLSDLLTRVPGPVHASAELAISVAATPSPTEIHQILLTVFSEANCTGTGVQTTFGVANVGGIDVTSTPAGSPFSINENTVYVHAGVNQGDTTACLRLGIPLGQGPQPFTSNNDIPVSCAGSTCTPNTGTDTIGWSYLP